MIRDILTAFLLTVTGGALIIAIYAQTITSMT